MEFILSAVLHDSRCFANEGVGHVEHRVDGVGQPHDCGFRVQSDDTRFQVAKSRAFAHLRERVDDVRWRPCRRGLRFVNGTHATDASRQVDVDRLNTS